MKHALWGNGFLMFIETNSLVCLKLFDVCWSQFRRGIEFFDVYRNEIWAYVWQWWYVWLVAL